MTDGTKEAGLVSSVLMYATRCLAEADWTALRAMRFGPREIEALREMSMADLYRIEALRGHCLEIRLDRQVWWQMIEHLRDQRKAEEALHSLVAADAPQEMLQLLFGIHARTYSRLRRNLSVDPSVGRPAEPDEESINRLWQAWPGQEDDETLPDPQVYLRVHHETGIPMRAIWNLTQRWAKYGHPGSGTNPVQTGRDG